MCLAFRNDLHVGSSYMPIHCSRVLKVPIAELFNAFANPNILTRWYGPNGFTSTFHEFHFRPGGDWKFDLNGPDGAVYPNHNVFRIIEPGRRVVFDHIQEGHDFQLEYLLTGTDGGSRVDWTMTFVDPAHEAELADFLKEKSEENLDRLANVLDV